MSRDMTKMVEDGYQQISRKYRLVARLPKGETGLEALKRVDLRSYLRIMNQAEHSAADTYRRMHAREEGNEIELDEKEFEAFRKAGGTP